MDISAFYLCWLFLWRSLPPAAQLLELPALKHMTGTKQWLPSGGKKYCCGWRCTHNRPFENLKKNKMLFLAINLSFFNHKSIPLWIKTFFSIYHSQYLPSVISQLPFITCSICDSFGSRVARAFQVLKGLFERGHGSCLCPCNIHTSVWADRSNVGCLIPSAGARHTDPARSSRINPNKTHPKRLNPTGIQAMAASCRVPESTQHIL